MKTKFIKPHNMEIFHNDNINRAIGIIKSKIIEDKTNFY